MSVTTPPPPREGRGPLPSPPSGTGPPPGGAAWPPGAPDPIRRWSLRRVLLGCAIVLLAAAISSAVFVLEEVHTLTNDLGQNGSLQVTPGQLAVAGYGQPQTLLLVGDDQRSLTRYYHVAVPHLANEMLLVRIDPSKPYISMMSIPRELWVPIHPPGGGTFVNRINAAYTYGIGTLVQTIKQDIGLSVNHVVVITFGRFKRAVDQMGCVYSTVDRRYFHVNVPGGPQYQEINLQPGYQKLCGDEALQFVSYRHGDTSQVRDARDQSFLLDVKKQYGPTLVDNIHKFEQIFGQAVQTDPGLQSADGILNLLSTLIASSGRRVRQVHFQANLLATYDTASPQQVQASVHAFLFGGSSDLPKKSTAATAKAVHNQPVTKQLPMVTVTGSQLAQARSVASQIPFPLEYPRAQDRGGASTPASLRSYLIHAPDGSAYPIYASVFATATLGQFYDVQGTTWTTAPQFDSPEQTVAVGGRTYYLYYEGQNLRMVAWYEHGAVYWIRNTLTDDLSNGEMLAIAAQTKPFVTGGAPGRQPVILQATGVPTRTTTATPISLRQTLGAVAGLISAIGILALIAFSLVNRRKLTTARAQLELAAPSGQRLSASLAHLPAVPLYAPPPERLRNGRTEARAGRRWWPVALAAIVLAGAIAGGVLLATGGASAGSSTVGRVAAAPVAPPAPDVPVTVLNSGSSPGAARALAQALRTRGVQVGAVGNVTEARPPGLEILYVPGQQPQARLLARVLRDHAATVAPIDPVAAGAAGPGAQLVVVIS